MCLVIDVNSIPAVFDPNSKDHEEFEPVKKWIIEGKGKMIYGGTKFINELGKLPKYAGLINQLSNAGKTVILDKERVDDEERKVEKIMSHGCDDPHLIAIVRTSKCRVVCTKDSRADRHLKDHANYVKVCSPPKIYKGKAAISVINDRNCVKCCQ